MSQTISASSSQLYEPVLIRGMSSEIGLALAAGIKKQGGRAFGLCRSQESLLAVRRAGFDGAVVEKPEDLPSFIGRDADRPLGFVDLAHSRTESLLASLPPDKIDAWAMEDIALRARWLRSAVRMMLPGRKGRCLFLSSTAAAAPAKGQAYYAAAKAAGESLYASTGLEMGAYGITACSLRCGWLDAGRGKEHIAGAKARYEQSIPTGRLVSLDEAAETLLFLLSEKAASFNAATLTLDGGFTMAKQMV